jgi:hypothetical protein
MRKLVYQNPGELFIEKFGVPRDIDDVIRYADFLREAAGVGDWPAIDLTRIFERFGIQSHRVPLVDQQGSSDGLLGLMLIKEDDSAARQRFSEAHELIELLFYEYKQRPEWKESVFAASEKIKERACQKGAAALVMPRSSFVPAMLERGFSFDGASGLAAVYGTSLLATIYQMLDEYEDERLLVVWRLALKPTEVVSGGQAGLAGNDAAAGPDEAAGPQRRLRIWWTARSAGARNDFIPAHQSAAEDSVVARCYGCGERLSGGERFRLKGIDGRYQVEAKRVNIGEEMCVLSLLQRYR